MKRNWRTKEHTWNSCTHTRRDQIIFAIRWASKGPASLNFPDISKMLELQKKKRICWLVFPGWKIWPNLCHLSRYREWQVLSIQKLTKSSAFIREQKDKGLSPILLWKLIISIVFHAILRFQINSPISKRKDKTFLPIICSLAKKQIIVKSHARWTIRPESSNTLDNLTQVFGQYLSRKKGTWSPEADVRSLGGHYCPLDIIGKWGEKCLHGSVAYFWSGGWNYCLARPTYRLFKDWFPECDCTCFILWVVYLDKSSCIENILALRNTAAYL